MRNLGIRQMRNPRWMKLPQTIPPHVFARNSCSIHAAVDDLLDARVAVTDVACL